MAEAIKNANQITNDTTVGVIDRAIKIWKDKLKNPKKATELEYAKNKIISHHRANRPYLKDTTYTTNYAYRQLAVDNYREASINKINALIRADKQSSVDFSAPKDPNAMLDFFEGKKGLNLATLAKTATATALVALAAQAGTFSLLGTAFAAMWAFNPVIAVCVGTIGAVGLLKVLKKAFGPELKQAWKQVRHKFNENHKFKVEEQKAETEELIEDNKKQDKEEDKLHQANLADAKAKAAKLKLRFATQDKVDRLKTEMTDVLGLSEEEADKIIKEAKLDPSNFSSPENFENEYEQAKGDAASKGQIEDFLKEYNKLLDQLFDKNIDYEKDTTAQTAMDTAITNLKKIADGRVQLEGKSSKYKLSETKAKAFAEKLCAIIEETYEKRKSGELEDNRKKQMNEIYKQHGIKNGKNAANLDAEFSTATP